MDLKVTTTAERAGSLYLDLEDAAAARQGCATLAFVREKSPLLERLSWIAGIVGAIAAVVALWPTGDGGADPSGTPTSPSSTSSTEQDLSGDSASSDEDEAEPVLVDEERPDPAPPPADFPADSVEIETLVEGQGPGATAGQTITVHYVGVLADGTIFDQSWNRGEPFTVALGEGNVIPGWEEGLSGVTVGERRRLVIGASKAYGSEGNGTIPPDAPLAFEIDVLDIR